MLRKLYLSCQSHAYEEAVSVLDFQDCMHERMVKFDKAEVTALLGVGEATLTITGEVNGTPFEGSDSIRVISPSTRCGGCKGFKK